MQTTAKQARRKKQEAATGPESSVKEPEKTQKELVEEHLPPLPLAFVILFCSGALLVLALRDFLTTGRNIGGAWDEAMMVSLCSNFYLREQLLSITTNCLVSFF